MIYFEYASRTLYDQRLEKFCSSTNVVLTTKCRTNHYTSTSGLFFNLDLAVSILISLYGLCCPDYVMLIGDRDAGMTSQPIHI